MGIGSATDLSDLESRNFRFQYTLLEDSFVDLGSWMVRCLLTTSRVDRSSSMSESCRVVSASHAFPRSNPTIFPALPLIRVARWEFSRESDRQRVFPFFAPLPTPVLLRLHAKRFGRLRKTRAWQRGFSPSEGDSRKFVGGAAFQFVGSRMPGTSPFGHLVCLPPISC